MGQCTSCRSEVGVKSPSSKSDVNSARTKFRLPLVSFMLKKIKKRYQNDNAFKFIDFPILIVENLLQHLSPSAILALRATCHKTKAWIDDNDYVLKDFNLRIKPETCECNSPPETGSWRHFSMPYVSIQSTFIQDTLDRYCDIILSLEIYAPETLEHRVATNYPCQDHRCLFDLIRRCRNVQCVSLCRLDSLTEMGDDSFSTLLVLDIDKIQWMEHSDFLLFESLIMKCPQLEYLKIPKFESLESLVSIFYDAQTQPEVLHMVLPLLTYLDRYRSTSSTIISSSKKLYIDFAEFNNFKLCSCEAFYNLSRKCVECNAVLMNAPTDEVLRNRQDIFESFASIRMFGFIRVNLPAELWQNLEVMEFWVVDCPDDMELVIRQLFFVKTIPKMPNLKSLTIRLSVDDPYICSAALEACVGQNYSEIEKLSLKSHSGMPERFVKIPCGFWNAFCNLKHLYLQELDSKNEDFQRLWPSLQVLEVLFVANCPYLTQEAFLGHNSGSIKNCAYQPPVLKMSRLQVLFVVLYDGVWGFDDLFLKHALRFMRLKGFTLRGIPGAGMKFTEPGMLSLLNSPFHDTIEDFEAPSSLFTSSLSFNYWSFDRALPKNQFRRSRICSSVFLNSISSFKHVYNFKRKSILF